MLRCPRHVDREDADMAPKDAPKRTYHKPEVRDLGSLAVVTKAMMMGSTTDMMGGEMNSMM